MQLQLAVTCVHDGCLLVISSLRLPQNPNRHSPLAATTPLGPSAGPGPWTSIAGEVGGGPKRWVPGGLKPLALEQVLTKHLDGVVRAANGSGFGGCLLGQALAGVPWSSTAGEDLGFIIVLSTYHL